MTTGKTKAPVATAAGREQEAGSRATGPITGDSNGILNMDEMNAILGMIDSAQGTFTANTGGTLLPGERMRKVGPGIKNYGFIEAARDLAIENPATAPQLLDIAQYNLAVRDIEYKRNILLRLKQFTAQVSDSLLESSDVAYRFALEYYNYAKMYRNTNPQLNEIYRRLATFFKNRRPARAGEEPTGKEVLRDVRGLLQGTKDGRVVIENVRPAASAGVRRVVDETGSVHIGEEAEVRKQESV